MSAAQFRANIERDLRREESRKTGRDRPSPMDVDPGYTRVSGFYGRYNGPGQRELKFHDVTVQDNVVTATAAITDSLIKIAQDTTEKTRIGRKVQLKGMSMRYTLSLPAVDAAATEGGSDIIRVMVYLDTQCNGSTATTANILESDIFESFNNLANKGRFRVLLDRYHTMNPTSMASDGTGLMSTQSFEIFDSFYKKFDYPIEYDSTAGAITEIKSNNIGLLLITQAGKIGFDGNFRFRFEG